LLKIFQSCSRLRDFTVLVPLTGTAQKQHDLTVDFCEVDATDLAKLKSVQTTTQVLSRAKVIIFLDGVKSSLYRAAKRTVQPIKPVDVRNSSFAGFICF